jgi:uncharacterized protein YjdB
MKPKIVMFFIVCLVYLTVFYPGSVNAAQTQSMQLDGNSYQGTTESSVTYKLSTKESSLVKIRIVYGSTSTMTATLTNLSTKVQKNIESSIQNEKSSIEFTYYAESYNYELTLNFTNGSNKTNYSLVGKATPIAAGEKTSGNTLDYAVQTSSPNQIDGMISFGDNADCYKISLNSQQTLKIKFVNLGDESVNLKFYDTYKDLFQVETIGGASFTNNFEIPNANGIYYLVVDRVYTNGYGTPYKLTIGDFVALTSLKFSQEALTLTQGSTKTVKALIAPSNATETFSYKSSNKDIATIDSSGKIKAIKAGTVTITAYSHNGVVKTSLKLTVKAKTITKVTLNATRKTMEVGNSFQLKPMVYPKGLSTTYIYTSSDNSIAKVDKYGKVTAIKKGSCIITVTTKNGKSTSCKVTVTKKDTPKPTPTPKPTQAPEATVDVKSIEASSNVMMLKVGKTNTITYTILPSNATDKTVYFSSLEESIATVDSKGVVTAVALGTTIVNGTTKDGKTMFVTVIVY